MKKYVLGAAALIGLALLTGCSLYGQPAATNQGSAPAASPASSNAVSIKNFAFNPATLTVSSGTTVTWMNNDSAPHQIKSDTFNSSALNQGEKFEFKFDTPGTFNYSCSIHPSMKGTIIVQ